MDTIYLIDGSSFLYRFFFAIKNLSYNGFPTNAIFGFARLLLDIEKKDPKYIVILFDTKEPTFRKDILSTYKENRPPMPDELSMQIEPIKNMIKLFGINIIEKDGYEADDLIGTTAKKFKGDFDVVVVTPDKDLLQLVDEAVVVYDPVKDKIYNKEDVYERLGVFPNQVIDYIALIGDSADNIPGVKSIGPKTASALLSEYKNIDGILSNLENLKPKIRKAIENDGNIKMYRKLVQLENSVPIDITLEDLKKNHKNEDKINDFFLRYNFKSFITYNKDRNSDSKIVHKSDFVKGIKDKDVVIYAEKNSIWAACGDTVSKIDKNAFDKITVSAGDYFVYDIKELLNYGLVFDKVPFDIKTACYLIDPDSRGDISKCFSQTYIEYFNRINNLSGLPQKLVYAALYIKKLIEDLNLSFLLNEVELPLSIILYHMEKTGVKIDVDYLTGFKNELENKIKNIEKSIYAAANEEFNINSTKELQRILFEKLGIKPTKKTKTGYSTDAASLEKLAKKNDIAGLIIDYRTIAKVISTYINPFMEKVDKNSRLHTTFNQTLTSTGRLSSSNPNLQNLPAADDEIHSGIRRAVIAEKGYVLVCSDYSQIELRVLCELSKDEALLEIFKKGMDIHTQTAVKLFNMHPAMVDHNARRMAKTINFGILYGMGALSLSKQLNISKQKAEDIIEKYFDRFPKVRNFINSAIEYAEKNGFSETYFKRRRYFPNINSKNSYMASFEKRAAVNMKIQGTAADIIKMAMIKLDDKLKGLDADIIMQVHDELLIETKKDIADNVKLIIKDAMENVVNFTTPLNVSIKIADNWLEAK